ncbi:CHAT domain protein [Thalassoglobus neptunius]|uniref:CHAT domain protein n=1 Tax=Thalassoglobus neptunius TaxID=1938619 RepID=A0A5C5X5N2_9PLAN|nr:CHAT domain-containing protein [Thalassoglobus neptunius]TWT57515.1 CHAT domain protein [Thalassoglobus neptunius]
MIALFCAGSFLPAAFSYEAEAIESQAARKNLEDGRTTRNQSITALWGNGEVSEALASGERVLAIEEQLFPPDDLRLATRSIVLSNYALELGRDEVAERHSKNAVRVLSLNQPEEHWRVAAAKQQEGFLKVMLEMPLPQRQELYAWQRQLQQAVKEEDATSGLEAAENLAKVTQENFGERHPFLIMAMTSIQSAQLQLGQIDTVGTQLAKLRIDLQQVQHPQHPDHAVVLNLLAQYEVTTGDLEKGLSSANSAIEQFRNAGQLFASEYLSSLEIRGAILLMQGEIEEALPPLREAYAIGSREGFPRERLRPIADNLVYALRTVARSKWENQDWMTSRQAIEEAKQIVDQQWGTENFRATDLRVDPVVTTDAESWSDDQWEHYQQFQNLLPEIQTLSQSGKATEALALARKRLGLASSLFGQDSLETLRARFDLLTRLLNPQILGAQDHQQLRHQITIFLVDFGNLLGTDHWEYASACSQFAASMDSADPMMMELMERAAEGFRSSLGEKSDQHVDTLTKMGCVLAEQLSEDAVTHLNQAIQLWESRPGRGSYAHCVAVASLGAYYYNFDDPYEARHRLAEAAELLRNNSNDNIDYDLGMVLNYLGNVSADQGRNLDAVAYYSEAIELFENGFWNPEANRYGKSLSDYTSTYEWCLYNAANSYDVTEKYQQAETVLKKLIARYGEGSLDETYRSAHHKLAVVYAKQDRDKEAQQVLKRISALVAEHFDSDPLIVSEHFLVKGHVAILMERPEEALRFLDQAFESFQKIDDLNKIDRVEWGYFDINLLRLREHYESIGAWDRVVAVREFATSSEAVLYAKWPDILDQLRVELELARRIAALDEESLPTYTQLVADTDALKKQDANRIDPKLVERSPQLIQDIEEILGPLSLPLLAYAREMADYYESQELFDKSLEMSSLAVTCATKHFGFRHSEVIPLLTQRARLLRILGKYRESRLLAEQAVQTAEEEMGDGSFDTFSARLELATLYSTIEDFGSALPLARSASDGFRRLWGDENLEYATALQLTGEIYYGIGQPDLGHSQILKSYEVMKRILKPDDRNFLRNKVVLAVSTASNPARSEEAHKRFDSVVSEYEAAGLDQTAEFQQLLIHLGTALLNWNELEEAEQVLQRAKAGLAIDETTAALRQVLLSTLGTVQRKSGNISEAREHLTAALQLQEHLFGRESKTVAETRFQLAVIEKLLGNIESARSHVQQCLRIEQAELSKIGGLLSDSSLLNLLNKEERPLDLLVSLVDDESDPEVIQNAFQWTVQRKGLALDLSCRTKSLQHSRSFDTRTLALIEQIRLLNQELADLALKESSNLSEEEIAIERQKRLKAIAEAQSDLSERLRGEQISLPSPSAVLTELGQFIDENWAYLEFLKVDQFRPRDSSEPSHRYVAFIVRNQSQELQIDFADLGDAAEIESMIDVLRRTTREVPRMMRFSDEEQLEEQYRELAFELYEALLGPFQKQIHNAETLILGPDAAISTVPFAALVDADDRYLVESKEISYVSSARDLMRSNGAPGVGTVVISNPNFDADLAEREESIARVNDEDQSRMLLTMRGEEEIDLRSLRWKRLPGAEDEATDVEHLLRETAYGPVKTYIGNDAVEELLKSTYAARILHLATHGFYVPLAEQEDFGNAFQRSASINTNLFRLRSAENPLLRSGIVLAGANRASQPGDEDRLEDGWVTAQEIARMEFRNTELVVLSACESGLGDISSGQGVHGIRRAFLNAGAHSILTSLFKVPDIETRELMRAFYQQLLESPNRRAALCRAQRQRIKERREQHGGAHPFFWASFILFGSGN